MKVDKRLFLDSLGGAESAGQLNPEAKADAIEDFLAIQLKTIGAGANGHYPTVGEVEDRIETKPFRAGAGFLFTSSSGNMKKLPPMPAKPTLVDFFSLRFGVNTTRNHCLQSATLAMKNGLSEEIILACLLHDTAAELMRSDHGWWGGQLYEPYVPEKVSFAIRYHQALRFYPDKETGYEYPELYKYLFGEDYVPAPHVEAAWKMLRNHKWYMEPRLVTLNDLYSFDPHAAVTIEPFLDILGRHFRQPKEGLGNDNSPVAHMWRALARPDSPL
ncbi:MAG TPA: hypothetical protein VHZ74_04760 [Bryobacteraceae bacterium]|nr:hypothetical protein [Bryobacteraceae bacterium]